VSAGSAFTGPINSAARFKKGDMRARGSEAQSRSSSDLIKPSMTEERTIATATCEAWPHQGLSKTTRPCVATRTIIATRP
jgi:hypothetical protein